MLLAHTVIGRPGIDRLPRLPTFVFAVIMLAAGVVALALADKTGGGLPLSLAGVAFAALFLARGVAGYTPQWATRMPLEPFRTAQPQAPIRRSACSLGAGFVVLVILRLT